MNPDGTGVAPLSTGGLAVYRKPDWSPDGNTIVFVGETPSSGRGLYTLNTTTGVETPLVPPDGAIYDDPEWAPDGSKIFYHRNSFGVEDPSSSAVWSVNPDGTSATMLTTADGFEGYPAPSPDGASVAYRGNSGFGIMNPDGSNNQFFQQSFRSNQDWQPTVESDLQPLQLTKTTTDTQVSGEWKWNVAKWTTSPLWAEIYKARPYHYKVLVESHGFQVSQATVTSKITLTNPNNQVISGILNDVAPGATCTVTYMGEESPLSMIFGVAANSTVEVTTTCTYTGDPGATLTNTASFDPDIAELDTATAQATANIDRTPPAGSPGEQVVLKDPMYKKGTKVLRKFNALTGPTKGTANYSAVLGLPSRTGIAWCHNISNTAYIYDTATNKRAGKSNKVTVRICKPPDFYSRHDKKNPTNPPKPVSPKAPKAKDGTPKVSDVLGGPKYINPKYKTRIRTSVLAPRRVVRGKLTKIRVITRNTTRKRAYGVIVKAKLPRGMKLTVKPRNVHLGKNNTVWWTTKVIGPRKRIARTLRVVPIRTGKNRILAVSDARNAKRHGKKTTVVVLRAPRGGSVSPT